MNTLNHFRLSTLMLLMIILVASACGQQVVREGNDSDIPIPSQNIGDDDDDDATGDDDDAAGDDDDAASDDDDAVGDDDDAVGDDDDDDDVGDDDDATPEPTVAVNYTMTDDDSLLYVQVFKDTSTFGQALAHNHVMRASNWTGYFDYDPADLSSCSLEVSINVNNLLVDEDAMRDFVGYGDTINNGDRNTIRQNMLASDQLDANNHSTISVVSTSCGAGSGVGTTDGVLEVAAEMELRGVTQNKTIDLDLTIQNGEAYMQGSFDLTATEFGFSPYSAFGGAFKNLDQMTISFDMVGIED